MKDLPDHEMQALLDYEKALIEPPAFSLVDGTPVQTGTQFDRYGRCTYTTPGGITRNTKGAVEDRLHPKPDMQRIFDKETDLYINRHARTKTSERTELRKSPNILGPEDLIATEKGNVGIRSNIQDKTSKL